MAPACGVDWAPRSRVGVRVVLGAMIYLPRNKTSRIVSLAFARMRRGNFDKSIRNQEANFMLADWLLEISIYDIGTLIHIVRSILVYSRS